MLLKNIRLTPLLFQGKPRIAALLEEEFRVPFGVAGAVDEGFERGSGVLYWIEAPGDDLAGFQAGKKGSGVAADEGGDVASGEDASRG